MGRLILLCGIPNAGKTTYSELFENVYHADNFRRDGADLREIIKQSDVVIEGIFGNAETRRRIVKRAGKPCTCIWMNTPLEECLKRENRGRGLGMIRYHHRIFEPPTYEEGWDEIIVIKEGQGNEQEAITTGAGEESAF